MLCNRKCYNSLDARRGEFFFKGQEKSGDNIFLRSEKALNEMVGAVVGTNPIFEIGPGEGVLTEKLLEKGFTVTVIEIDKRSIEILERKFAKEIAAKKTFYNRKRLFRD
jgi:16S rRNA (adenine1518-N6/adenine1519-N6)-dimethyltransferase